MAMKLSTLLAGAAALAFAGGASLALADGGGGGMSSAAPSGSSERADPAALYQAGVTALQASNFRDAIRHLRAARRELPNDPNVNYALGLAYLGADEPEDARGALERATRSDAAPAAAWLQLGLVALELGDRAAASAQQAALARLIGACDAACGDQRRGQLQTAHDQLARALEAPPAAQTDPATTGWNFPSAEDGRAAYAEAVGYINQERFPEAFAALTRAHAAVGPHPDVLNYMGFVSRKMGRFDVALAYYDQALRIDPNHLGATEYLGELYLQMGDVAAARRQLARLDQLCAFGCAQREELARWIETTAD